MTYEHLNFRLMAAALLLIFAVSLSACSNMSTRDKRMATGAGIGAGTGALVSHATGGSGWTGAAIGAGAGAVGGYIYDKNN